MTGVLIEDPDQFDLTVISHGSAHKGYSNAVDWITACISPISDKSKILQSFFYIKQVWMCIRIGSIKYRF